ncbi:MAG: preprotein translocase subunit YajC [Clostridia bacterium]|nr:preprotein translocase subunit YajC [Clostridia bacterium]
MGSLLFANDGLGTMIILVVLLVLIVGSLVMSFMRRNKYNAETQSMLEKLNVGVKVKTFAGIYGEIVEIRDALDGSKVALIKSGENGKESYISIDLASVYAIDEKDNAELFMEEKINETSVSDDANVTVADSKKDETI